MKLDRYLNVTLPHIFYSSCSSIVAIHSFVLLCDCQYHSLQVYYAVVMITALL